MAVFRVEKTKDYTVMSNRIRWFRNRIGLTQKQLGMRVGFPDSNADIRIAQYEVGTRKPKADLTAAFAKASGNPWTDRRKTHRYA